MNKLVDIGMYGMYIKERLDQEIYITNEGFFTYWFNKNYIEIIEFFIMPEFRDVKTAQKFLQVMLDLGKSKDKEITKAFAAKSQKNYKSVVRTMQIFGKFKVYYEDENYVYYFREI